ncbi:MAG: PAS domain S-box protein, partial [Chloroflexota bacterium]|nr:PAS domain S-box protein [Chloroflexota bacterium]
AGEHGQQIVQPTNLDGSVMTNIGEGICAVDELARVTYLNPAAERMLGWSQQDLLGQDLHDSVHCLRPNRAPFPRAECTVLLRVGAGETITSEDDVYVRRDGSVFPVEYTASPVVSAGQVVGAVIAFRDITDRKRAEEQIRLQAQLLDEVEAAVIATDVSGTITHWNAYAERLYGWSRADVLGRSIREVTVGPTEARLADEIMEQLRKGRSWRGEFTVQRKDGSTFLAHVSDSLIIDSEGKATGIVGVSVDVSERKELEEQLRRQLTLNAALTYSLGEGVFAVDSEGNTTFLNPAAERMLGWSQEELCGRNLHAAIHYRKADGTPVPREECPILLKGRAGMTASDDDDVFFAKDGTMIPVAYTASPIVEDGAVVGIVGTFRDMTEIRRLQQAREEYIALVSHDLGTPLTALLGHSQMLVRSLQRQGLEREARSAEAILGSGRRMQGMIQDLLDASRLETGRMALQLQRIRLDEMFESIIEQVATPADRRRFQLVVPEPVEVTADPARIERVATNLLTNALKYSEPKTPIVVRVEQTDREAVVSVLDHGPGISATEMPCLFEKYYRGESSATSEGLGLGLYSSRLIAEAHGGRIWAESKPGVGSTFYLALPRTVTETA